MILLIILLLWMYCIPFSKHITIITIPKHNPYIQSVHLNAERVLTAPLGKKPWVARRCPFIYNYKSVSVGCETIHWPTTYIASSV